MEEGCASTTKRVSTVDGGIVTCFRQECLQPCSKGGVTYEGVLTEGESWCIFWNLDSAEQIIKVPYRVEAMIPITWDRNDEVLCPKLVGLAEA